MSNHDIRTRWTHFSFDSISLFARCDDLDDALQVPRNARPAHAPTPQRLVRSWRLGSRRVSLCLCFFFFFWDVRAPFGSFNADASFSSGRYWLAADGSDTSSIFTSSDSVDFNEHTICNPVLELPLHVQVGAFMEAYFDESDLVKIALSCHFALDVLCDKAEVHCSDECSIRHHCPWCEPPKASYRECDHPGSACSTSPRRNDHQQMVVTHTVYCQLPRRPPSAPLPPKPLCSSAPLPQLYEFFR